MPIISKNIRLRVPDDFVVGENSIVDDFCYFSTPVEIGRCSHVASGCSVAGGKKWRFKLGDFCSLSSGVKIWCGSDDFVNDVVAILPPEAGDDIKENFITGDVILDNYTAVGANSVIMPQNHLPEGTVIGALSFVPANSKLEPWSVYAGTPIRFIKKRNKGNVLGQVKKAEEKSKQQKAKKE